MDRQGYTPRDYSEEFREPNTEGAGASPESDD